MYANDPQSSNQWTPLSTEPKDNLLEAAFRIGDDMLCIKSKESETLNLYQLS